MLFDHLSDPMNQKNRKNKNITYSALFLNLQIVKNYYFGSILAPTSSSLSSKTATFLALYRVWRALKIFVVTLGPVDIKIPGLRKKKEEVFYFRSFSGKRGSFKFSQFFGSAYTRKISEKILQVLLYFGYCGLAKKGKNFIISRYFRSWRRNRIKSKQAKKKPFLRYFGFRGPEKEKDEEEKKKWKFYNLCAI